MKVPSYEQKISSLNTPNVPTPQIPTPPEAAFGGGKGRALERFGGVLEGITSKVQARIQERQKIANKQQVASAYNQGNLLLNDVLINEENGLLNRKLGNASGIVQEYRQRYMEEMPKIVSSIQDPDSQVEAMMMLDKLSITQMRELGKHEASEFQKNNDAIFEDEKANDLAGYAIAQDEKSLAERLDLTAKMIADHDETNGVDPKITKTNIKEGSAKGVETAIMNSLAYDPTSKAGMALLKSAKKRITAEKYNELEDKLAKASKQKIELEKYKKEEADYAAFSSMAEKISSSLEPIPNMEAGIKAMMENGFNAELGNALLDGLKAPLDDDELYLQGDDVPYLKNTRMIYTSGDEEDIKRGLISTLRDLGDGKLTRERAKLLIVGARQTASDRFVRDILHSGWAFSAKAKLLEEEQAVMQDEFFVGLINGINPRESMDSALRNEIMRQNSSDKKEKILATQIIDGLSIGIEAGLGTNLPEIDKNITQLLIKSGVEENEAAKVSKGIMKSVNPDDDPLMIMETVLDGLDDDIPSMRFNTENLRDYIDIVKADTTRGQNNVPQLRSADKPFVAMTKEELKVQEDKYNAMLLEKYPRDIYTGVPHWKYAYAQGILPILPKDSFPPGLEEQYPVAGLAGQVTGYTLLGFLTGGIAPTLTQSLRWLSPMSPFLARAIPKMSQRAALWGGKSLLDNLARIVGGEKKSAGKVVKEVSGDIAFGAFSGAVSGIGATIPRIAGQGALRGSWTAAKELIEDHNIDKKDMLNIFLNTLLGAAVEAINAKQVSRAYKLKLEEDWAKAGAVARAWSRNPEYTRANAERSAQAIEEWSTYSLKPFARNVIERRIEAVLRETPDYLKSPYKQAQFLEKFTDELTKGNTLSNAVKIAMEKLQEVVPVIPETISENLQKASVKEQFENPGDVALLDYLSKYMDPKYVAGLPPEERLKLGNSSPTELRDFVQELEASGGSTKEYSPEDYGNAIEKTISRQYGGGQNAQEIGTQAQAGGKQTPGVVEGAEGGVLDLETGKAYNAKGEEIDTKTKRVTERIFKTMDGKTWDYSDDAVIWKPVKEGELPFDVQEPEVSNGDVEKAGVEVQEGALVEEAKKYKSAEEFVTSNKIPTDFLRDESRMVEGFNVRKSGDLRGYGKDAPLGTWEDFKKSIQEEGIKNPVEIYVEKDGKIEIIEGTHRLLAASELGIKEVPYVARGNVEKLKEQLTDIYNKAQQEKGGVEKSQNIKKTEIQDAGFGLKAFPGEKADVVGGFRTKGIQPANDRKLRFIIQSKEGVKIGDLDLKIDTTKNINNGLGEIKGIVNLELSGGKRGKGIGTDIVNTIRSIQPEKPLKILDVDKKAKTFWEKLGAEEITSAARKSQNKTDMIIPALVEAQQEKGTKATTPVSITPEVSNDDAIKGAITTAPTTDIGEAPAPEPKGTDITGKKGSVEVPLPDLPDNSVASSFLDGLKKRIAYVAGTKQERLKSFLGETKGRQVFEILRLLDRAVTDVNNEVVTRNKKIFNTVSPKVREYIFDVIKGIQGLDADGNPIFGALQPAGEVKGEYKTGQVLDDGRIVGHSLAEFAERIGADVRQKDLDTFITYRSYDTKEQYLDLIKKHPKAKDIIDKYLANEEEVKETILGTEVPAFARDIMKQQYDINTLHPSNVSYVPGVLKDISIFGRMFNLIRGYTASGRKLKTGALAETGLEEKDIAKALTRKQVELAYENLHNNAIGDILALTLEPIEGKQVKKGFTAINMNEPRMKKIAELKKDIFQALGIDVEKLSKYQYPSELNHELQMPVPAVHSNENMELARKAMDTFERNIIAGITTNYLLRPSTAERNLHSGAIQYSLRPLTHFYEGLMGEGFSPVVKDLVAPIKALLPEYRIKVPTSALGKIFVSGWGTRVQIYSPFLKPFQAVEFFWKRAVFISEMDIAAEKAWKRESAITPGLNKKQYFEDFYRNAFMDMFQVASDNTHSVTFDYSDKPLFLEKLPKSIVPFPNYFYHKMRMYAEYSPLQLIGINKSNAKNKIAKALAGMTLMALAWKKADEIGTKRKELLDSLAMKRIDINFDTTGRLLFYADEETEKWLRVYDLPFLGDMLYAREMLNKSADFSDWVRDTLALGPVISPLLALVGLRSKYQAGKSTSSIMGETIAGFIPFGAYIRYLRVLADPVKRDTASNDYSAFENFINPVIDVFPGVSKTLPEDIVKAGWKRGETRKYDIEGQTMSLLFSNIKSINKSEFASYVGEQIGSGKVKQRRKDEYKKKLEKEMREKK